MAGTPLTRPVYVIYGSDPALTGPQCEGLIEQLLEPQYRSVGLVRFEGGSVELADVLDELHTIPLLGPRRVVVVRDADKFINEHRAAIESYLDGPSTTGVLILVASNWDGRTTLAKKLDSCGLVICAEAPKPWQMSAELINLASQRYGKHLSKEAACLLVELVGEEWARLCSELEKLALYVADQRGIDVDDVDQLVGRSRTVSGFSIINKATKGQIGQAMEDLRDLFAQDNSWPYTMVGAIAYHLRRLLQARMLLDKGLGPDAIATQLKIFWKDKAEFFSLVQRLSAQQITVALKQLAMIDYKIKTGKTRPDVAIERLILGMYMAPRLGI